MINYCWTRVIAVCLLTSFLLACSGKIELMGGIAEAEANEVLAALQNAGITADKLAGKEGMVGVSISADQVGKAVDLLRSKGLPRERFAGMGQVFKKEGLISSPLEERARYLYALSQELGATLSQIDGVVVARVHVVLPERGSAGDPNMPSSAAIFIKYQEGYNLDTVLPQIRRLVTNSIPGLTPEKVSIVMVASQPNITKSNPNNSDSATPAVSTMSDQTGFLVPIPFLIALAILLLGALLACSLLAWKFWWPVYMAKRNLSKSELA